MGRQDCTGEGSRREYEFRRDDNPEIDSITTRARRYYLHVVHVRIR